MGLASCSRCGGTQGGIGLSCRRSGISVWHGVALAVPRAWALWLQDFTYFAAFSLGVIAAFAEIIGKFRDEPLKALRTTKAVIYHELNRAIAEFY